MGKKKLTKKSTKPWTCSICNESKKMCKHLEAELARLIPNQCFHGIPVDFIDKLRGEEISSDREVQKLEMFSKLKSYSLPEIYANVLVLKFVNQWSFADIALELDMPHKITAWEVYQRALKLLRERGYK